MKYFVSYTTRDKCVTLKFLEEVDLLFSQYGEVYIDIIHNDSIDKQLRVMTELKKCDEVILIETKSIMKSDWVKIEIEKAEELNKNIRRFSFLELNEKGVKEKINRVFVNNI